ncbi:MAG: hypothetical protein DSY38_03405 [Fusobacteria bacterium]|nr:MAG: hypothetical protein DSY38_03405 [Fusobacteriota bacterium]
MKKEILEILMKINHFPCRIKKREGEILKKFFLKDNNFNKNPSKKKDQNNLEFRYIYEEDGIKYILLEEYLFKEGETFLTLENSIGVDYYLNKI